MSHIERLKVAFLVSVIAVGVLMVADIILSLHIGDFIISPVFFIPALVVAYLAAPFIGKHIRYK